jgi:hypothetical protein
MNVLYLFVFPYECENRDIEVCMGGRPRGRSSSPGRVKNFHVSVYLQTGSESHPASYLIVTRGIVAGALS